MTNNIVYLSEKLARLTEVTWALMRDTERCRRPLLELGQALPEPTPAQLEEGQFWLRTLARTFFTVVEGVSFAMQQMVLEGHQDGVTNLKVGEQAMLRQERYQWQRGKVKTTPSFNTTLDNLHLALSFFPRLFAADFKPNTSDQSYVAFKKALGLRHTITHPKRAEDLLLSETAINDLGDGMRWCSEEMKRLLAACSRSLQLQGDPDTFTSPPDPTFST